MKRLEGEGYIRGQVARLNPQKLSPSLTAFMLIKTQQHSSWYQRFVEAVQGMLDVIELLPDGWRV